ncbi:hypothetical protein AcV5_009133 [Taiwanofungus camphoratus]|nr:hypothetical protein AcV5_009133 [Antrodia cinnamomea]KAI0924421.1 hypothetical protein AcW2_005306 [Antrodia cinnamomea]KAI0940731.1 hypothetical protein AcV7_003034 [Antrodia cinnamomea]
MFVPVVLAALLARLALVHADPTPTTPGPGDVYKEGSNCDVAWNVDSSGIWKTMNIELMTGSNTQMVYLTTVATVDGTDASNTSLSYPCPGVAPNAPIYFYQFSSPFSKSLYWTTRFAIADASGNVSAPAQSTQPGGQDIPWGTGALAGSTDAAPEPSYGQSASGAAATSVASSSAPGAASVPASLSASTLASAPVSAAPASSAPVGTVVVTVPPSSTPSGMSVARGSAAGTGTSAGAVATPSAGSASAGGSANGAGSLKVDAHVYRAALALGVAALTFAVAL